MQRSSIRNGMGVLLVLIPVVAFGAMSYEEGVSQLSKSIVAEAAKFKKQRLAVVDFTDLSGNVTELGRFLAEELSVSLVLTGAGLEMVDRTQLNKIFQEQALSFSGAIDPAAVKKVGNIAGVDALIAGTITDLSDTVRLTVKIIATDTGRLVSAARVSIPKTGTITQLMEREVEVQGMAGSNLHRSESQGIGQRGTVRRARVTDLGRLDVVVESIEPVGKESFVVFLAFTNKTEKDIWVWPPNRDKVFASDELGNMYSLQKSTGMDRYTSLYVPPKVPARSSFLFSAPKDSKRGAHINISAQLSITNKKGLDFSTTATFLNLKPDK